MAHFPPQRRTSLWLRMPIPDETGQLVLPRCRDCGAVQYPPRELCRDCLGDTLEWKSVSGAGTLLSWALVHVSLERFFAEHAPWPVGRVRLESGPVVIAHLGIAEPRAGMPVTVHMVRDAGGAVSIVILPGTAPRDLPAPISSLAR